MQITEAEALQKLRDKVSYSTKIKHLAEGCGVSAAFMSMVLSGNKPMTEPMLKSIGVRKVVIFETT